jgi:hypothetical protein
MRWFFCASRLQVVADMNVELTMKKFATEAWDYQMIDKGDIILVGAMYDLAAGKVSFYD